MVTLALLMVMMMMMMVTMIMMMMCFSMRESHPGVRLNGLTKNPNQKECLFRVVEDYRHSHPGRTKKAAFGNK